MQGIAALIFNRYVFAFEATSALLITAAVGAMVLAHRERLVSKRSQADLTVDRMRRYAESGQHPGPLPTPGVFARHNAVDTPALLPDGSASTGFSDLARSRHHPRQSDLVRPVDETVEAISASDREDSEPLVLHRPVRDLVQHRRSRLLDPAERHRGLHVRGTDAQRPTWRWLRTHGCTATSTARSRRSSSWWSRRLKWSSAWRSS